MMKLYARALKGRLAVAETEVCNEEMERTFQDRLEKCLIGVCSELNISVPLWIDRNTSEFVCFKRTFFTAEQFIDEIKFDRLMIEMYLDEE